MNRLIDAFWRAAAYCLHPRVIALSLLPLLVMCALLLGLGYFLWEPAVNAVFRWLEGWSLMASFGDWLQGMGLGGLRTVIAPLIVIFGVTPLIIIGSIVAVAWLMTPALVRLVGERRFPTLEHKRGGSFWLSLGWSTGAVAVALLALLVTLPLWFIPPLFLVLPPLVWGWLTYRVMAFDALAEHASADERRELMRRHRGSLLAIGVLTGYLGAAPSVVWASGALFAAMFVVLIPLAVWIYTLVFVFSSLWFAHFALAALESLRAESAIDDGPVPTAEPPLALPDVQQPPSP